MTSCSLMWKDLTDHFTTLEHNLMKKLEALKQMIETLNNQTQTSLESLKRREVTIDRSDDIVAEKVGKRVRAALESLEKARGGDDDAGEVDDDDEEGLLSALKSLCLKMDTRGFWSFVTRGRRSLRISGQRFRRRWGTVWIRRCWCSRRSLRFSLWIKEALERG
ncbi:unnamed protein product [Brassica rapa]|uniref:Uncharacterized protein n=1 Tax=Brassica campestris TaxID=3711 RepID=A0A3P5ZG96_BRACM|nr:unnamed protein product [Brassica rapa]VDC71791.1 unnamed protein product [Brassica rapa]